MNLIRRLVDAERAALAPRLNGAMVVYTVDSWPPGTFAHDPAPGRADYRRAIEPDALTPDELRAAGWEILTRADLDTLEDNHSVVVVRYASMPQLDEVNNDPSRTDSD